MLLNVDQELKDVRTGEPLQHSRGGILQLKHILMDAVLAPAPPVERMERWALFKAVQHGGTVNLAASDVETIKGLILNFDTPIAGQVGDMLEAARDYNVCTPQPAPTEGYESFRFGQQRALGGYNIRNPDDYKLIEDEI